MYNTMKSLAYLDKNELNSLQKWQEKIISAGGLCLFECHNETDDIGFMFAFQMKNQKEIIKSSRVLCLDGTYEMNPIAFLISEFKRTITLKKWLNYLKHEHNGWNLDIFMMMIQVKK